MRKEEIIRVLKEKNDYVSGQELCEYFGVSRTAVWKAVKQLEKDGYTIDAVNNKGYRLTEVQEVMSAIEISQGMETVWAGKNLIFRRETGSTNIDAKQLAEEGACHGTLVVADKQNAGRGRRGRTWTSPMGESVYMTLLLRPKCEPNQASMLTLVMALAVLEAMEEIAPGQCQIKWPNDIVMNQKKICGILTEMSADMDDIHYVVTGAGINVNQTSFPQEFADKATSIYLETGERAARAALINRVLYHYEQNYTVFEKTFDLSGLADKYNRYLVNKDKEVRILDPKGDYEGKAIGINKQGELQVVKPNQEMVNVYAGEVSVRGIYGYV